MSKHFGNQYLRPFTDSDEDIVELEPSGGLASFGNTAGLKIECIVVANTCEQAPNLRATEAARDYISPATPALRMRVMRLTAELTESEVCERSTNLAAACITPAQAIQLITQKYHHWNFKDDYPHTHHCFVNINGEIYSMCFNNYSDSYSCRLWLSTVEQGRHFYYKVGNRYVIPVQE